MSEKPSKGQSMEYGKIIVLTLLVLVAVSTIFLYTGFGDSGNSSSAQEWEYLVVGVGVGVRIDFSSAWTNKGGKVNFMEAVDTENDLDKLGRKGWELVDVVGVLGGDQQEFVFKRPIE